MLPSDRPKRVWVPESPHLILNRTMEAEAPAARTGIEGIWTVELIHARTGLVKRRIQFRNLITDTGLNALAGGTRIDTLTSYYAVGTASNEPKVTDASLGAELARTNSDGGFAVTYGMGPANAYAWRKKVRLFTESQANGNLTEVAAFNQAAGGVMLTRQLFKDEFGAPTAITKTTDDQLRLTYEWRIYVDQVGSIAEVTIGGVLTTATTRAYRVDHQKDSHYSLLYGELSARGGTGAGGQAFESSNMPALTAAQSGTTVECSSIVLLPYTGNSFQRDVDVVFEPAIANFATNLGSVVWAGVYWSGTAWPLAYITTFGPKVAKNNQRRFTFHGRVQYGRHTP